MKLFNRKRWLCLCSNRYWSLWSEDDPCQDRTHLVMRKRSVGSALAKVSLKVSFVARWTLATVKKWTKCLKKQCLWWLLVEECRSLFLCRKYRKSLVRRVESSIRRLTPTFSASICLCLSKVLNLRLETPSFVLPAMLLSTCTARSKSSNLRAKKSKFGLANSAIQRTIFR